MHDPAPHSPLGPQPESTPAAGEIIDHRLTRLEENLMHESYLREQQHEQILALLKLANQLTQRIKGLEARLAGTLDALQSQASDGTTSSTGHDDATRVDD